MLKAQQATTAAREEAAAHASRANSAESTVATLQESVEKGCALRSARTPPTNDPQVLCTLRCSEEPSPGVLGKR